MGATRTLPIPCRRPQTLCWTSTDISHRLLIVNQFLECLHNQRRRFRTH